MVPRRPPMLRGGEWVLAFSGYYCARTAEQQLVSKAQPLNPIDWRWKGNWHLPPLWLQYCELQVTHESGVNSSCSLLFIGEQMRDTISSARLTQLTLRLGFHTTPAARLWLGVGAASLCCFTSQRCSSSRTALGCLR